MGVCEAYAAHFYGELRSVAEQVVPQLKRQAQERRAEERRRSPHRRRSVAAQAQVFSEAPFMMAFPSSVNQLRLVAEHLVLKGLGLEQASHLPIPYGMNFVCGDPYEAH